MATPSRASTGLTQRSSLVDPLDWWPGWIPPRHVSQEPIELGVLPSAPAPPSEGPINRVPSETIQNQAPPSVESNFTHTEKSILVLPTPNRVVNRKLRGIHLFMITINATVGVGLYWRGGQVLELGGPLAILLSFSLVGFIAWAVMQCITEMLCIWPVPGAFSVYVSEFVDAELGHVVGLAYWYTYSVSFSALLSTLAAEIQYWTYTNENINSDWFNGTVVYFFLPLGMVLLNCLEIDIYGHLEVIFGFSKLVFYVFIAIVLILINAGVGQKGGMSIGLKNWKWPMDYDKEASSSWGHSLLICISIASFAYVGVEIVAASALEVKPRQAKAADEETASQGQSLVSNTVKLSAVYIPVVVTIGYALAGFLISLDMPRDSCDLPRVEWVEDECDRVGPQVSVFVKIADKIPHMNHVFNVFVVLTAVTTASTNLYVASRSLFGLTSRIDGGHDDPWYLKVCAYFGRTNNHKVPIRAVIFSALAFWWVPFLELIPEAGKGDDDGVAIFVETLARMGTVGVLIVWACLCVAFIRYYHCIYKHREYLEREKISQVRRWSHDNDDYPYRSHLQPYLAYVALAGCIFLLLVCNSAPLWDKEFRVEPFLSSYLVMLVFLVAWIVLKIFRGPSRWFFVDLSQAEKVAKKIRNLHDIRVGAS